MLRVPRPVVRRGVDASRVLHKIIKRMEWAAPWPRGAARNGVHGDVPKRSVDVATLFAHVAGGDEVQF